MQKKFTIRLNSLERVEQLLQETYDLFTNQINQVQGEIVKIANSTTLNDVDIDVKEKYGKIMNNYLATLQKAIDGKFSIARFMGEVVKYGGDVNKALDEGAVSKDKGSKLNLDQIRKAVKEMADDGSDGPDKYHLKRVNTIK